MRTLPRLALVVLVLTASLALRAQAAEPHAGQPAATDAAFLAQLGTPAPIQLADCMASTLCPCISGVSQPLSCTGTSMCEVINNQGHLAVECDGHITNCPGLLHC